ncbi:MAG: hypothetical protein FJ387_05425 [Verrucomicrobia bacterium]|nr:hypothetical protein [Verrucomicrobiota bacterium]
MSASATLTAEARPPEGMPRYRLTSDIAQFCLPASAQDTNRKYAYACSIYLSFLIIGLVGMVKVPKLVVRELPSVVEFTPVEIPQIEPTPVVQTLEPDPAEPMSDAPSDAPPAPVLVAAADAAVPFAVPTEGYVQVTKLISRAEAPPAVMPRPPPPTPTKPSPSRFGRGSGARGSFPSPTYPSGVLRSGQSVEGMLLVHLANDGSVQDVEVLVCCGVLELDRRMANWVRARWKWDLQPGQATLWEVPFAFAAH